MSKIVTANMLATGTVVFLGSGDAWVEDIKGARLFADASAAEEGLQVGLRDAARALIVEPFVTDAGAPNVGRLEPTAMSLRDTIRAYGPTIAYLPSAVRG